MSAIGQSTGVQRGTAIGAHADFRRADFVFPRTQSCELQSAIWVGRLQPLKPWGRIAAELGAIAAACCLVLGSVLVQNENTAAPHAFGIASHVSYAKEPR